MADERITADPNVLVGKPVVRGTRLSVDFVLSLLADRWTRGEILDQYPSLTDQDITACLEYARDVISIERVHPTK